MTFSADWFKTYASSLHNPASASESKKVSAEEDACGAVIGAGGGVEGDNVGAGGGGGISDGAEGTAI
jgi:hypothetical protein